MKTPDWMAPIKVYWGWIASGIVMIGSILTFIGFFRENWRLVVVILGGIVFFLFFAFLLHIIFADDKNPIIPPIPHYKKKWRIFALIALFLLIIFPIFLWSNIPGRTYIVEALVGTQTPTPAVTPTPPLTHTPTSTSIPSTTPTSPPSPSLTPTPTCPYQGSDDEETFVNLIRAEAEAVNLESMETINKIFAPDALFYDVKEGKSWLSPKDRYQNDLFLNANSFNVEHFGIVSVGRGENGEIVYYVSGSSGSYFDKNGGPFSYYNGAKGETTYGSDHWAFRRNSPGCWVIIQLEFNAGDDPFPP